MKDSPSTKVESPESDVSDVEQEGYCDDSSPYNVEIIMKLAPVKEQRIKDLYKDIEQVVPCVNNKYNNNKHYNNNVFCLPL